MMVVQPHAILASHLIQPLVTQQQTLATDRGLQVVMRVTNQEGEVWVDASGIAAPWPVSVVFAAGASTTTLRGQAEPTETAPTTRVKTEISTAAPVIKAFAKSGAISFRALNSAVSPSMAKPSGVRKFLAVCK